jgi:hypothetical protein
MDTIHQKKYIYKKIFFCGAFHQQSYHLCFCFFDQGLAEKYKKTMAWIVLRWASSETRSSSRRHQRSGDLKENHGVFDFELSREDMDLLKELDRS